MSVAATTQNSPYAYPNTVSGSSTGTAPRPCQTMTKPGQHCPSPYTGGGPPGTLNPTRRETVTRCEAWREEW